MTILYWLICAHFVCDYPLQGDFLARGKNHKTPIPGVPWYQCLIAHAFIQGAGVALVTHSVTLGILETVAHADIDYLKSQGWYGFNADQLMHIACKVLWALMLWKHFV